jgi:hypothetical protein
MAGCSTQQKVQYEPVERQLVLGDDAMGLRQWSPSASYYANGDTAAWSTRYPISTDPNRPERQNIVLEPLLFIGQTVALPLEFVANPPFSPQVYHGVEYRPTHSFQPPLGYMPESGSGNAVGYGGAGPSMRSAGGSYGGAGR